MNKNEILKVVEYKGDDTDIKPSVTRIRDVLTAIPKDVDFGEMASIETFKNNGGFGEYNFSSSRIDKEEDKNRILSNLESVFLEINSWIKNHPFEIKYIILNTGRKKNNHRRKILIAILVVIAVAAITFILLQRVAHLIPDGVPVGEIIGLVDFILGIGGLIYELKDDGRKEAACGAVNDVENSKTTDELLTSANKFVKVITKIDNSHHNVRSVFGGKVVDNSANYTQIRDDRNE